MVMRDVSPDIIDRWAEIMWPVSEGAVQAVFHAVPTSICFVNTGASLVIA